MIFLTDYSIGALRIIQAAISEQINTAKDYCDLVESKVIASPEFKNDLKRKEMNRLPVLREFNVQLLNAIQVVKDKQAAEAADPERFQMT